MISGAISITYSMQIDFSRYKKIRHIFTDVNCERSRFHHLRVSRAWSFKRHYVRVKDVEPHLLVSIIGSRTTTQNIPTSVWAIARRGNIIALLQQAACPV